MGVIIFAGLAYCVPLGNGSEWRVLHFSPSFQQEFGEYKKFRKALINDSVAVTGVAASSALITLALGSEIAIQSRKKEQFSFGLTYSWIAGKEYKNKHLTFFYEKPPRRYSYFTLSSAYIFKQHTPFIQFSFGHRLTSLQVGYNYCIASSKSKK